jgi:hypothetical protein
MDWFSRGFAFLFGLNSEENNDSLYAKTGGSNEDYIQDSKNEFANKGPSALGYLAANFLIIFLSFLITYAFKRANSRL